MHVILRIRTHNLRPHAELHLPSYLCITCFREDVFGRGPSAPAKGGSPNTSFGRRAGGGRPTRRWGWGGEAGVGMGTAGEVVAGGLGHTGAPVQP